MSALKNKDIHQPKKTTFIKLPRFTGGKKAFLEFVATHLVYPEEAIKQGIEGTIHAEYEVDNRGKLSNIRITNGIGYGCDEEALRIIGLLAYEPVHNRGIRLKTKFKARILFKLPKPMVEEPPLKIHYAITPKTNKETPVKPSYSYTINLG